MTRLINSKISYLIYTGFIVFIIFVLSVFTFSVRADIAPVPIEPDPVIKSNTFKDNSLLTNIKDKKIQEFVNRMDNDEFPKWCKLTSEEGNGISAGSLDEFVFVDVYNALANVELEQKTEMDSDTFSEEAAMRIRFFYDDLDVEFVFSDTETFLCFDMDSDDFVPYKVYGTKELFDYADKLWLVQKKRQEGLSYIKNPVFRVEQINSGDVSDTDNYMKSAVYIVTEEKELFIIKYFNITCLRVVTANLEDSYDIFLEKLERINAYTEKELKGKPDDYNWNFYLYEDNEVKKEYSGYIAGISAFENMIDYLENSIPVLIF